ncbi:MAG: DUF995 domain-containing protein [Desulfurivibrionaceae bacterium]|nr:DUF995 domain-containing protein [Desulfurivibrionaceae bacterium]
MKKQAGFFFLLILVAAFLGHPGQGVAAELPEKRVDLAAELSDKTFFVKERTRDKKAVNEFYAYFKKEGELAIKFTPTHFKSGEWRVDGKRTLCLTRIWHKSNQTSINITKCGRLVKESPAAYTWYDEQGEVEAHFLLEGEGNRLP